MGIVSPAEIMAAWWGRSPILPSSTPPPLKKNIVPDKQCFIMDTVTPLAALLAAGAYLVYARYISFLLFLEIFGGGFVMVIYRDRAFPSSSSRSDWEPPDNPPPPARGGQSIGTGLMPSRDEDAASDSRESGVNSDSNTLSAVAETRPRGRVQGDFGRRGRGYEAPTSQATGRGQPAPVDHQQLALGRRGASQAPAVQAAPTGRVQVDTCAAPPPQQSVTDCGIGLEAPTVRPRPTNRGQGYRASADEARARIRRGPGSEAAVVRSRSAIRERGSDAPPKGSSACTSGRGFEAPAVTARPAVVRRSSLTARVAETLPTPPLTMRTDGGHGCEASAVVGSLSPTVSNPLPVVVADSPVEAVVGIPHSAVVNVPSAATVGPPTTPIRESPAVFDVPGAPRPSRVHSGAPRAEEVRSRRGRAAGYWRVLAASRGISQGVAVARNAGSPTQGFWAPRSAAPARRAGHGPVSGERRASHNRRGGSRGPSENPWVSQIDGVVLGGRASRSVRITGFGHCVATLFGASIPGRTRASSPAGDRVRVGEEGADVEMGGTFEPPLTPQDVFRCGRLRYEAQQAAHADIFRLLREREAAKMRWLRIVEADERVRFLAVRRTWEHEQELARVAVDRQRQDLLQAQQDLAAAAAQHAAVLRAHAQQQHDQSLREQRLRAELDVYRRQQASVLQRTREQQLLRASMAAWLAANPSSRFPWGDTVDVMDTTDLSPPPPPQVPSLPLSVVVQPTLRQQGPPPQQQLQVMDLDAPAAPPSRVVVLGSSLGGLSLGAPAPASGSAGPAPPISTNSPASPLLLSQSTQWLLPGQGLLQWQLHRRSVAATLQLAASQQLSALSAATGSSQIGAPAPAVGSAGPAPASETSSAPPPQSLPQQDQLQQQQPVEAEVAQPQQAPMLQLEASAEAMETEASAPASGSAEPASAASEPSSGEDIPSSSAGDSGPTGESADSADSEGSASGSDLSEGSPGSEDEEGSDEEEEEESGDDEGSSSEGEVVQGAYGSTYASGFNPDNPPDSVKYSASYGVEVADHAGDLSAQAEETARKREREVEAERARDEESGLAAEIEAARVKRVRAAERAAEVAAAKAAEGEADSDAEGEKKAAAAAKAALLRDKLSKQGGTASGPSSARKKPPPGGGRKAGPSGTRSNFRKG